MTLVQLEKRALLGHTKWMSIPNPPEGWRDWILALDPKTCPVDDRNYGPLLVGLSLMGYTRLFARRRQILHVALPKFTEARIDSADLTEVQPAEYRADLVVLLLDCVPVLARRALQAMDPAKYEYPSDFARHYIALGQAQGEARGRAAVVAKQLALRFGPLAQEVETRIAGAAIAELDQIAERLLSARTLREALGLP